MASALPLVYILIVLETEGWFIIFLFRIFLMLPVDSKLYIPYFYILTHNRQDLKNNNETVLSTEDSKCLLMLSVDSKLHKYFACDLNAQTAF